MVIKCPKCNRYISDTVTVCPHCGFDLSSAESSSLSNLENPTPEELASYESSLRNCEPQAPIVYNEGPRKNKRLIVTIAIGCLVIAGIFIGIVSHSPQESKEALVMDVDSVIEVTDSVEEFDLKVSFSVTHITSSKETDDINTEVSIDFPQTDNEYLQSIITSFIIQALTNDFTWGENSRPRYRGDTTDGHAIADFFVKDKVREIADERERDSVFSPSWDESIAIKMICETKKLVSYEVDFSGSHGGVGGGTIYGVTFSKNDGNLINVISNSSDSKLLKFLKRYIPSHLSPDDKEVLFVEEFYNHPYPNKAPFVTDKGVRFIYQKYEIGAGALGVVDITIPFSDIAEYMSDEALMLIGYVKD